jgi:hypothetical protein
MYSLFYLNQFKNQTDKTLQMCGKKRVSSNIFP